MLKGWPRPDLNRQPEYALPQLQARRAPLARVFHRRQMSIEAFKLPPVSNRRRSMGAGARQQVAALNGVAQERLHPLP
jgi:hypothetical protein